MRNARHPLLSVCIPTFNRCNLLEELLQSIVDSLDESYNNNMEIVISDNGSSDETGEVVKKYTNIFKNFQYHHHSQVLLPAEKNFLYVASQAKGDYIWLMGDDDKFNKEALGIVLKSIATKSDIYLCNFSLASKKLDLLYNKSFYLLNPLKEIVSKNELLSTFGPTLSLISSVIFNKKLLEKVNKEQYLHFSQYGMSFLYFVYSSIEDTIKAEYIHQPIFLYRCENSVINNWEKVFVTGIATTLEAFKKYGYSNRAISKAKNICIKKYVYRELLSRKARGVEIDSLKNGLYKHYLLTSAFWIMCFPILIVPDRMLCIVRNVYQKYFK